jgi:hypothetical protein
VTVGSKKFTQLYSTKKQGYIDTLAGLENISLNKTNLLPI